LVELLFFTRDARFLGLFARSPFVVHSRSSQLVKLNTGLSPSFDKNKCSVLHKLSPVLVHFVPKTGKANQHPQ
jgi:hypothetical protein